MQVVQPGVKVVDPALHGKAPGAERVGEELGLPQVIADGSEGSVTPGRFLFAAVEQARAQMIVAIAKDRCGHRNGVAQHAFGGVATAVYLR